MLLIWLIICTTMYNTQLSNKLYVEENGFEVNYKKCILKINKLKAIEWGIYVFLVLLQNTNVMYYINVFSYCIIIKILF